MTYELSPDMIWYSCEDCERGFTLADLSGEKCPHCSSTMWEPYTDD